MAWVNGVSQFSKRFPPSFRIAQNQGEGLIAHGTRQWTDYEVRCDLIIHLGNYGGLALRVQGLRRFYGIRFTRAGALQIVRVRDEDVVVLAETEFELTFDETLKVVASVRGNRIAATVNDVAIAADDGDPVALRDGGIGLFIHEGALSTNAIAISG